MDKSTFMRQERDAATKFMDRWLFSDLKLSGLLVGYSRSYRCECGFECVESGQIYDHAMSCVPVPEQMALLEV